MKHQTIKRGLLLVLATALFFSVVGVGNIGVAVQLFGPSDNFGTQTGDLTSKTKPWSVGANNTALNARITEFEGEKALLASFTSDEAVAAHQEMWRYFDSSNQVLENGIVKFTYQIYFPSAENKPTKMVLNVSLTNSAPGDRLTYRFTFNGLTYDLLEIHPKESGIGENAFSIIKGLRADNWITVSATIDMFAKTQVTEVTDGQVTGKTGPVSLRNPAAANFNLQWLRVYFEKGCVGKSTFYLKNACMDHLSYAEALKEELADITLPEEVISDFELPQNGTTYGSNITWISDNTDAIAVNGSTAAVTPQESDASVKLTASAEYAGETVTKEFNVTVKNAEYAKKRRLQEIIDGLRFVDWSGQTEYYLQENFTPNVSGLKETDTITVSSNNENVLKYQDGRVVLTPAKEDTPVTVTLTLADHEGNSVSKEWKVMVWGDTTAYYMEDFEYSELKGSSINGASKWTVANDSVEDSVRGVSERIEAAPDDANNLVLDIHKLRSYTANQYATSKLTEAVADTMIVQTRMMMTGEPFRYNFYIYGSSEAEGAVKSIAQFYLSFGNHIQNKPGIYMERGATNGVAEHISAHMDSLPINQWFTFKVKLNMQDQTFDAYIDDQKLNDAPIAFRFNTTEAVERIASVSQFQVGAVRGYDLDSHLYMDDLCVRVPKQDILNMEEGSLTIDNKVMFDMELPDRGLFEGTTIQWQSSNTSIIENDGTLHRGIGFDSDLVTMTATINCYGATRMKEFQVEVYQQPAWELNELYFTTAAGAETLTPENGGKLTGVLLGKNSAATDLVKLLIGIYDGEELSRAYMSDVSAAGRVSLDIELPETENPVVKAFVWNMNTLEPMAYAMRKGKTLDEPITIYMCGDSTMAPTAEGNEQKGWGMLFGEVFSNDKITIANHAKGGRSSKSFYDEGRLDEVLQAIQPGDYMIIQFGHNDQKPEEVEKYTTKGVDGTYRAYLKMYVNGARARGAYPILATSIYRRRFASSTSAVPTDSLDGYPEEMIALAGDLNVPVLDLHKKSGEWLAELGYEASAAYFTDNTHLYENGARAVVEMAAEEIKRLQLPIANQLLN